MHEVFRLIFAEIVIFSFSEIFTKKLPVIHFFTEKLQKFKSLFILFTYLICEEVQSII